MDDGLDMAAGRSAIPAGELRLVQTLLWTIVSDKLRPAERDEVKRAIGLALIEENESLYQEATALAEILGDVQVSTAAQIERHQLCANPQRRLIEAEILSLMDRLRDAASTTSFSGSAVKDRDPESVVPKSNPSEKVVYNYITTVQVIESRPQTASSRPGSASASGRPGSATGSLRPGSAGRPMTGAGRPSTASTRCSRPSTASSGGSGGNFDPGSILQQVQDKLNVHDIDLIKEQVRESMNEEKTWLMEDIEYLQAMLEDESDLQFKAATPPPSVHDLKEYSSKLQTFVSEEESRAQHEARVSHMFSAAECEPSKAGRLRGLVVASRSAPEADSMASHSYDHQGGDQDGIRLNKISESPAEVLSLQDEGPACSTSRASAHHSSSTSRPSSHQSQTHSHSSSYHSPSTSRPNSKGADGPASSSRHHDAGLTSSLSLEDKPTRQSSLKGADELLGGIDRKQGSPLTSRSNSLTAGVKLAPISKPRVLAPLKGTDHGLPPAPPMKSSITGSGASSSQVKIAAAGSAASKSVASSSSYDLARTPLQRAGGASIGYRQSQYPTIGLQPPNGGLPSSANCAGAKRPGNVTDMLEAEIDTALSGGVAAILAKHGIKNPSRGGEGS